MPSHKEGSEKSGSELEFPTAVHLIVVCMEKRMRRTGEGVSIIPYGEFTKLLWQGCWNHDL